MGCLNGVVFGETRAHDPRKRQLYVSPSRDGPAKFAVESDGFFVHGKIV